jgi:2-phospho-L-lactate guanylyltransferase
MDAGVPADAVWTLVLPVKGGPLAKSRLGAIPGLAEAIAADTLDAVAACPAVARMVVVTADPAAARSAGLAGADVVAESTPGGGLLAAVRDGVAAAGAGPVAVLLADLPALRPDELGTALRAAGPALADRPMAAVPDAEGLGTVLLAAARAADLDPAFGVGSLAEHRRRRAAVLDLDLPRLRRDVDTAAELRTALAWGCGPRTTAVAALRLGQRLP